MMQHFSRRVRTPLLAVTSALLLAFAVGTASANNLSFSNRNQRIVWSALNFIAGSSTITCAMTLEGSFHESTTAKVIGRLLGYITRATVGTCTRGSATVLNETLPWHIQYAGFTGRLPTITSVLLNIVGLSWGLQPEGSLKCLLRTEANHPFRSEAIVEGGVIVGLRVLPEAEIPLTGEGGLCIFGGSGHFEGTGRVTLLGATTAISIRLI
ncbi:MAG TPA: hypothetical protein VFU94_13515 [Conexibacter sp.]|nr:hypothetical protein [Conexibacter sp.]